MSEPTNLPYYCPTFRTSHLLEPCTKNLARVKALKEAKKHVGPLEVCVDCKGKKLIMVPEPNKTVIEGLPAPESWVEERFVNPEPKEYVSPERKGWEPHPEVTTAPLFLKDVPVAAENRLLSPYPYIEPEVKVTRKPNWPEMKTLPPEKVAAGRKAGHNLGKKYKTRRVLDSESPLSPEKEEIYHRIMAKQEEILPELPKTKEISGMDPDFTGNQGTEEHIRGLRGGEIREISAKEYKEGLRGGEDVNVGARYCPTHPESLQRVDKLGRWMGMCTECLALRGKKCGLENFYRGVAAPPMSIPLNMPKYAEVKEWLAAQAEENERSLGQQVMFVLKMAWRQGT